MTFKLNRNLSFVTAGLLAFAILSASPALQAQSSGQPARAVRLSYVDGKVQLVQGGQPLANQAVINAPLFEGTQIVTGDDGKAEVQFEDGSVARVSPASSLTLTTLSSSATNLTLDSGLAYFELQSSGQFGPMNIAFADGVVTASGFTILRLNMDTPPGAIAVFSGNAHIDRGANGSGWAGSVDLHSGQSAAFNGADAASPNLADAIQPDSWDSWNADRDQALNAAASSQTQAPADLAGASASNPAWSDLDANGNWYNVPGQGYVWSPYDAANQGFDPYGNGAWMPTPGYGYVWASGYGWGYLPYQCGMWNFYDSFGWGWAPGFGGCSPWWGVGFYGGPRFGILPIGYQPPRLPIRGRGPGPGPGRPIPVNRTTFRANGPLPERTRNAPVTIAGQTVQPLRTMPGRTSFQKPEMGSAPGMPRGTSPGAGPGASPGNGTNLPSRPIPYAGEQPGSRSGYTPSRPTYTAPPSSTVNRAPSAPGYTGPGYTGPGYTQPTQRNTNPTPMNPAPANPGPTNPGPVQRYNPPAPTNNTPRPAPQNPAPRTYSPPPSAPQNPAPRSYSPPPRPASPPPPPSPPASHFSGGGSSFGSSGGGGAVHGSAGHR